MGSGSKSFLLVLIIAAAVRLLSWNCVFVGEEIGWIGGPDAYYHARRAELAAAGATLSVDRWTNYPYGEESHWPAAYDRFLGFVLRNSSRAVLAFVPLFCGVIATACFGAFARRVVPGGWLAAMLAFASLPAVVYPTALGAIDHHCLEEMLVCALLFCFTSASRPINYAGFFLLLFTPLLIPLYPLIFVLMLGSFLLAASPSRARAITVILAASLAIPIAGYRYFADDWIGGIDEAMPLIRSGRDLFKAIVWLSPGALFLPLVCPAWWKSRTEKAAAAALITCAVALPLTLIQARFTLYLAIPSALALGDAWFRARKLLPKPALLALTIAVLLPGFRGLYEMHSWPQDPPAEIRSAIHELSRLSEPAGDPLDPETVPEYGVVGAWDRGSAILSIGKLPVLADAFHTGAQGREDAHKILLSLPAEATRIADEKKASVLFLTDIASSGYAKQYRAADQPIPYLSLYGQLYLLQNNELGWRRIYASSETFRFEQGTVPAVQIWRRK